ncbi:class I SAM-dependent methyltransferase family protein [Micromonospora sp. LH3U1]|uniref:class I SAM-dependent methyltransferase family protein n=1 Tax=Micromonospora sp. LH3U1 TaxID=3018339 RepID=UPI00234B4CF1|nr:class I SAM-dependent methyltransferase family protein [Micromonospora sp. LH3U1]WCN82809.1 class I SAM-dependent methyltransferase family protein [Micromonospora sp. LH3U1]
MTRDWLSWHEDYDQPGSALAARLTEVQEQVRAALDRAPAGPLRMVSACAGQGRDLIPVLATHPRREEVTARLVELDRRNAATAEDAARAAGLTGVQVVVGDAALTDAYADLVPADLVLLCGVFGNVSDADVRATVGHCAALCANGGTVIWTRHRREPDLVPVICDWFAQEGFAQIAASTPAAQVGVGVHRHLGHPRRLPSGVTMFHFLPR